MKQLLATFFVLTCFCGIGAEAQEGSIRSTGPLFPEATVNEPHANGVPMPRSSAPQPVPQPAGQAQEYNEAGGGYGSNGQAAPNNQKLSAPTPYPATAPPAAQAGTNATAPIAGQNPATTSTAPNVSNGGTADYGSPAATPLPSATPLPLATAAAVPAATPPTVQQPAQYATPVPAAKKLQTPHSTETVNESKNQRGSNTNSATSPLWKVGGVVLTLLGLLVLVVFTPSFSAFTKPQHALIWAGAACAGLSQLADTFAGLSAAASPAQCMLVLAGFGGLTASGVVDGHRNRAAAGVLWLAASALVTHSISYGPQAAGAFSGMLAGTAAVCALALCAVSFSGSAATDSQAAAAAAPITLTMTRTPAPPAARTAMAPNAAAAVATQQRPPAARAGARQPGKGVARLIAVEGPLKGQVFTLMDGANAAGGDAAALDGNKIHLPGDDKVARVHAILMCIGNRCTVSDMASATGVFLNGGQVLDERDLMNGDRLQIGGTVFLYQRA